MVVKMRGMKLEEWCGLVENASQINFNTSQHNYIALHKPTKTYRIVTFERLSQSKDLKKLSFGQIVSKTEQLTRMLTPQPHSEEQAQPSAAEACCRSLMKLAVYQREKLTVKKRFILSRIWGQFCEKVFHFFHRQGFRTSTEVASQCALRFIGREAVLMQTESDWLKEINSLDTSLPKRALVKQKELTDFSHDLEKEYCSVALMKKALQLLPNVATEQIALCAEEKEGFYLNPRSHFNLFRLELLLKVFNDAQVRALFRGLFKRPESSSTVIFDVICAIGSVYDNDEDKFDQLIISLIGIAIEQDKLGVLVNYEAFIPLRSRLWGKERVEKWNQLFSHNYLKFALSCLSHYDEQYYNKMLILLAENNIEVLRLGLEKRGWEKYFSEKEGRKIEVWCRERCMQDFYLGANGVEKVNSP